MFQWVWDRFWPSSAVTWSVPDEITCRACEFLATRDLCAFSGTNRSALQLVNRFDASLWRPICLRRWRRMRLDPLQVYPAFRKLRTWRERYVFAEEDGTRSIAHAFDIQSVKKWRVKDRAREPYSIDDWPYRSNMLYTSPTFAPVPVPYVIFDSKRSTYLQVSGLPRIRILRTTDWGWELVNATLTLESVEHLPQPPVIALLGLRLSSGTAPADDDDDDDDADPSS